MDDKAQEIRDAFQGLQEAFKNDPDFFKNNPNFVSEPTPTMVAVDNWNTISRYELGGLEGRSLTTEQQKLVDNFKKMSPTEKEEEKKRLHIAIYKAAKLL